MPGKPKELLHLNKSPNHSFTFCNSSVYLRNIILYIICTDVQYNMYIICKICISYNSKDKLDNMSHDVT